MQFAELQIIFSGAAAKLLLNMLHARSEDHFDMVIRQRIVHLLSVAATAHQMALFEHAQLMRDRRLAHLQRGRNIPDTALVVEQAMQYADPRGIRKDLEQIGKVVDQFFVVHFCTPSFEQLFMCLLYHVNKLCQ